MMAAKSTYSLKELKFYVVKLVLHSVTWFSSLSQPHPGGFVQTLLRVIHNYPLTLALAGRMVEGTYVSRYGEYKDTRSPAQRFSELKVYAYPLAIERTFYEKILMSMSETDYLFYKPETRLIVPIRAYHSALAPGTEGRTVVITTNTEDFKLPSYVRMGVKRYGIWKLQERIKVDPVDEQVKQGDIKLNTPFNVLDTRNEDITEYLISLSHYAGDIASEGRAKRALKFCIHGKKGKEIEWRPIPSFIQL